ncbi:DUF2254 domain-containing protein [bacterium]|nr:DUF2254 domain-containing protein [bacterium]
MQHRGKHIKSLLVSIWDRVRFSFWFTPGLMALGSILLSVGAIYADTKLLDEYVLGVVGHWLYSGSAEGASSVLTTIASSMITIAGVVFSMTLVALTLASSQFGPRLLRNYMGDRSNQVVLGTFIATFLYCLLILRTIRHDPDDPFVPHLSVTLGVLLAIIDVGVLIHFIHHVALSVQGDTITARIGRELNLAVERLVPDEHADDEAANGDDDADPRPDEYSHHVSCNADGYLQYVDVDSLKQLAADNKARIRLALRQGQFLARGARLASLESEQDAVEVLSRGVHSAVSLGYQPTSSQDVEFGIRQLVEVALRALSPGVNEPFTAVFCLDRLGGALCRLEDRSLPRERLYHVDDELRLVIPAIGYAEFVSLAFDEIRSNLRGGRRVTLHMLETLAMVHSVTSRRSRRRCLRDQAALVLEGARRDITDASDLQLVEQRFSELFPDAGN